MTYKEYVVKTNPKNISTSYFGGVRNCPGTYISGAPVCGSCHRSPGPFNCSECWNTEMPEEKKEEPKIDIHKIIDEAMEKKDRTVSIYIGQSCVTINVTPYKPEEPAHWIYNSESERYPFECSACGGASADAGLYCSRCGEQMMIRKEEEEVEDDG